MLFRQLGQQHLPLHPLLPLSAFPASLFPTALFPTPLSFNPFPSSDAGLFEKTVEQVEVVDAVYYLYSC
jgi:hypothetical protein